MKTPIIFTILSFFLITSCGDNASETDSDLSEAIAEVEKAAQDTDNWRRVSTGSMGLSVECPFDFKETNLRTEIDPSVNHLIKTMETYMHEENTAVYMLNSIEYQPDVEVSLSGAVDGGVSGMLENITGKLLSRNDSEIEISGNKGVLTTGTVSALEGTFYFQNKTVQDGQKLYQIMGINMVEDKTSEANIQRFLKSAQID